MHFCPYKSCAEPARAMPRTGVTNPLVAFLAHLVERENRIFRLCADDEMRHRMVAVARQTHRRKTVPLELHEIVWKLSGIRRENDAVNAARLENFQEPGSSHIVAGEFLETITEFFRGLPRASPVTIELGIAVQLFRVRPEVEPSHGGLQGLCFRAASPLRETRGHRIWAVAHFARDALHPLAGFLRHFRAVAHRERNAAGRESDGAGDVL